MKTHTFTLKDTGKEYDAKFGGMTVELDVPETREEIRARVADGVDPEAVIDGFIFGQGIVLTLQKWAKDAVDAVSKDEKTKDLPLAEIVDLARQQVNAKKFGEPRKKGETKAAKQEAKLAEAEKKAEDRKTKMGRMYLRLTAAGRREMRDELIEDGIFTAEELDGLDAA